MELPVFAIYAEGDRPERQRTGIKPNDLRGAHNRKKGPLPLWARPDDGEHPLDLLDHLVGAAE
jgi:hypothetical protein